MRLRPLRAGDEHEFLEGHRAMAVDHFTFALGYEEGEPWGDYLRRLEDKRRGVDLGPDEVAATFLVATDRGHLVGRSSIRHTLNEFLAREGGHVGFGVLAPFRRRGYATDILGQSLVIARSLGVDEVLVTCDDDNVGSAVVIEGCGGRLDSVVHGSRGVPVRRYWIA